MSGSDCTSPPTSLASTGGPAAGQSGHLGGGQPSYHHGYPGPHSQYDSSGYHPPAGAGSIGPSGPADRNHNHTGGPQGVPSSSTGTGNSGSSSSGMTICGRPGCGRPVSKSGGVDANGGANTGNGPAFCSSECVVGQCREVYTSWAGANPGTGASAGAGAGPGGPGPVPQNQHAVK